LQQVIRSFANPDAERLFQRRRVKRLEAASGDRAFG